MAFVLQGSYQNEMVRLYFDIINNEVRGARVENDLPTPVFVEVSRTVGNRSVERFFQPGSTDVSFPGNRRFSYDDIAASWSFSVRIE